MDASLAAIAKAVGCSKSVAGAWRQGTKLPSGAMRSRLAKAYGIPSASWDTAAGVSTPELADEELAGGDDTLAIVNEHLTQVRRALRREGLTEAARAKHQDTATKLLALKARLERDRELLEDSIVREHPAWQRFKAALLGALRPWPDAAKAAAEAVQEIDG